MATGKIDRPFSLKNDIGNANFAVSSATTIAKSETKTFNVANSTRCIMCCYGASASQKGMYLLQATGSGSITQADIYPASDLTLSKATNSLTIANGNSSYAVVIFFIMFEGDITGT